MSSARTPEVVVSEPEAEHPTPAPRRRSVVELMRDRLSAWTVVAAAITLLYLVWATIDVLNVYAGGLPSVVP